MTDKLTLDDVKPTENIETTIEYNGKEAIIVYNDELDIIEYGQIERKYTKPDGGLKSEEYIVEILTKCIIDSSFDEPISVVLSEAGASFAMHLYDQLDIKLPEEREQNLNQN